jgi:hypothetical protein
VAIPRRGAIRRGRGPVAKILKLHIAVVDLPLALPNDGAILQQCVRNTSCRVRAEVMRQLTSNLRPLPHDPQHLPRVGRKISYRRSTPDAQRRCAPPAR